MPPDRELGAIYQEDGRCKFRVWAPTADRLEVHILDPEERWARLKKERSGYFAGTIARVTPGTLYRYRLNEAEEYADPASRFQPQGVHGPSQVVDPAFAWTDRAWMGLPLTDYVIYELHVGCFTEEGTFQAVIPFLDELKELGITALEIMPVSQFPGQRNWGYDGVFPYALQNSYGGPDGLKQLIDACHDKGIALVLDVVYNHAGPEGCVLERYGPYFTDSYKTPWGRALNFDQAFSDEVRHFFVQNALHWVSDFHVDALRLDALHAIYDSSAQPFLAELSGSVKNISLKLNREVFLFAESDLNDRRLVLPKDRGGYALDAHWNEDFHHALHAILTGERQGYYCDFGRIGQLAKALRGGFVYTGQYSQFRQKRHGSFSTDIEAFRHVVFIQNHDQVGNRPRGERLSQLISFEKLKLAAAVTILSPNIPLIFMGEEYGEPAPFEYFTDHSDKPLIEAVKKGRQLEFAALHRRGKMRDPQAEETFLSAKLHQELSRSGRHKILFELYRELLRLRKEIPALADLNKNHLRARVFEKRGLLLVTRRCEESQTLALYNFSRYPRSVTAKLHPGCWRNRLDTSLKKWSGPGSRAPERIYSKGQLVLEIGPNSCVLFVLDQESLNGT